MPSLTVALITYQEADRIEAALDSVRFADEILVVDGGSTDGTLELCRKRGVRVLERPFDGFVSQKQFALEQASHPWVLALDADERVSPELAASIRQVLAGTPELHGFSCARRNFYLGRPIRFAGWYPDRKLRLVDKQHARWGGIDPHDRLEVSGPVGQLEGDLLHHSYRSLEEHAARIGRYARIAAEQARARGRKARALDLIFRPGWYFLRRYVLAQGFREGLVGLILCGMGAWHVFLKGACLLELEWRERRPSTGTEGAASQEAGRESMNRDVGRGA